MKRMYISAMLIAVLSSQMQAWVTPFIVMANEAYKARSAAANIPAPVVTSGITPTPAQLQQPAISSSTPQSETMPTQVVTNSKPFIVAAGVTGLTIAAALLARKPSVAIAAVQTAKADVATSYRGYQAAKEYFAELYQAVAKTKAQKVESVPLMLPAPAKAETVATKVQANMFKCNALGCNAAYSLKNSLEKHKSRMHPSLVRKEALTCCGRVYLDGYHLERHRTSVKHLINSVNSVKKA